MKCPRCKKAATVENEMFCAHPLCALPLPIKKLTERPAMRLGDLVVKIWDGSMARRSSAEIPRQHMLWTWTNRDRIRAYE
jgi:hypothetical protein